MNEQWRAPLTGFAGVRRNWFPQLKREFPVSQDDLPRPRSNTIAASTYHTAHDGLGA